MSSGQKQPSPHPAPDAPSPLQWEDDAPFPYPEPEIDGNDLEPAQEGLYDYRAEIRKATKGYAFKPEPTQGASPVEKTEDSEIQEDDPIEDHRAELRRAQKSTYSYSYTKTQETPRPLPSRPPVPPSQGGTPRDKPRKARKDLTRGSPESYVSTTTPNGTRIINVGPGATITNVGNNYSGATIIEGDRVTTFPSDGSTYYQRTGHGGTTVVTDDEGTWVQNSDGTWTCYGDTGNFTTRGGRNGGWTSSFGTSSAGAEHAAEGFAHAARGFERAARNMERAGERMRSRAAGNSGDASGSTSRR